MDTTPSTTPTTATDDILPGAADYLATYGHTKGGLYEYNGAEHPPACALGAIDAVAGLNDSGRMEAIRTLAKHIRVNSLVSTPFGYGLLSPATLIVEWNDQRGVSSEDVVLAMKKAAADA